MRKRCEECPKIPHKYVTHTHSIYLTIHDMALADQWQYNPGDVVILTDDTHEKRRIPTRKNMIDAMRWLVHGAKAHDALFFHCTFTRVSYMQHASWFWTDSGHGGQINDLDGDEIDGLDEGWTQPIIPYSRLLTIKCSDIPGWSCSCWTHCRRCGFLLLSMLFAD